MKKITLVLFYLSTISLIQAQCTQAGRNFGNNTVTGYDISGNVDVTLNANNTVTVNLANNFSTAPGPDVRIFLVDRGNLSDAQLKIPSNFLNSPRLEVGLLTSFNGTSSYNVTIPNNANLADYQTIFFYCLQFNQFWDYGSYTPIDSSNCTLSNDSVETNNFSLFPNPAVNQLIIESNVAVTMNQITIHNVLGEEVYFQNQNLNLPIDIRNITDGFYVVRILSNDNQVTNVKLVKKS